MTLLTEVRLRNPVELVTVIADASYHTCGAAGWGAWVSSNRGKRGFSGGFKRAPSDSTQAELWAAINGLYYARRLFDAEAFLLQSDCQAILNKVDEMKKSAGLGEARLFTRHVKGHSYTNDTRSWVQRWCDHEAGKHSRRALNHRKR